MKITEEQIDKFFTISVAISLGLALLGFLMLNELFIILSFVVITTAGVIAIGLIEELT